MGRYWDYVKDILIPNPRYPLDRGYDLSVMTINRILSANQGAKMVDNQLVVIAGSVAGALGISVTLLGRVYGIFLESIGATDVIDIATMALTLYALLVLSI